MNADIDVNIVIWTVYKENFPLTKQKLYSYPWITPKIKWLVHQKTLSAGDRRKQRIEIFSLNYK